VKAKAELFAPASAEITAPRLRASVAIEGLGASASVRYLSAAIISGFPSVSASWSQPLAGVDYIDLIVGARVDESGRFKFIQSITAVVDGTAYSLSKVLGDSVTAPDTTSVSALKALADGLMVADNETVVALKALAGTAPMLDDETIDVAKLLQDAPQVLDLVAKVLSRPLADTFGMTDDETVAALKGLSDSVTMQDTVATLLIFTRNFSDTVATPDLRTTTFVPATRVEQISVADVGSMEYQKNLADGFAMNDGSEAVDGSIYSFSKGISNVAFVGDAKSLIFAASRVESVSVADAGLLSVQDYCDLSYFAEDYVGLSQSF
jgi:hypothetical protein